MKKLDLTKVRPIENDDTWYIIPNEMYDEFLKDCKYGYDAADDDYDYFDYFDNKWGDYSIPGDLDSYLNEQNNSED